MQELHHEAGETLKGSRDANRRRHLDEDTLGRVDVYLELAGLVDGRVQEGQEALERAVSMVLGWPSGVKSQDLVRDVGARVADVSIHLAHHTDVLIAVEERVLVLAVDASAAGATMRGLVSLEAGIGQDHNEPLRVLVGGRNRDVLLRH